WAQFPPAVRQAIERDGAARIPSAYSEQGYLITRKLIEDGRQHFIMRSAIPFDGPVRLLHGMRDDDVPWQRSLALAERLAATDVRITLVKDGDHRLSREADLAVLMQMLAAVLD
ncbi:MAG: alpha/beta hydrolase, partial [Stellaceae bacterium]